MRMFITSKNKYLSNDMKIFGTCPLILVHITTILNEHLISCVIIVLHIYIRYKNPVNNGKINSDVYKYMIYIIAYLLNSKQNVLSFGTNDKILPKRAGSFQPPPPIVPFLTLSIIYPYCTE